VNLAEILEPIAAWFRGFGTPEVIVHWGHPAMMGIVILAMGSFVGYTGWQGRLAPDKDVAMKNRGEHRKLAPLMFLFMALGYTGGVLSLVMQQEPILESSHFWTGSGLLLLLGINSAIAFTKFAGGKAEFRSLHAYIGSTALVVMLVHAALGLKLGLSL
jgi:fucose 4-O-acetylase-like acetyltransferase